jgi:hypothetical protein
LPAMAATRVATVNAAVRVQQEGLRSASIEVRRRTVAGCDIGEAFRKLVRAGKALAPPGGGRERGD